MSEVSGKEGQTELWQWVDVKDEAPVLLRWQKDIQRTPQRCQSTS
jgi:hypothetical protein